MSPDGGGAERPGRSRTERGLPRARKRFGQHFLADRRIRKQIVDLAQPENALCVVEIGPGRGALTDLLVERARRLVAIEVDHDLAAHLTARYEDRPSVTILDADVLEVDLGSVAGTPFTLVGNVPYYITTPILFHALQPPRPTRAVFLVQREVAERMVASPGTSDYGALSVNLQLLATARIAARVPPGAFVPPPKVDSAVVVVEPRSPALVRPEEERELRGLVISIFGLRRKQMRRVLRTVRSMDAEAAERVLAEVGIAPEARPEELGPEKFVELLRALK